MLIGPHLLTLNDAEHVWSSDEVTLSRSRHTSGGCYYELMNSQGRATVAELIAALQYLPADAKLRDVFLDDEHEGEEKCYINIWKEAA